MKRQARRKRERDRHTAETSSHRQARLKNFEGKGLDVQHNLVLACRLDFYNEGNRVERMSRHLAIYSIWRGGML